MGSFTAGTPSQPTTSLLTARKDAAVPSTVAPSSVGTCLSTPDLAAATFSTHLPCTKEIVSAGRTGLELCLVPFQPLPILSRAKTPFTTYPVLERSRVPPSPPVQACLDAALPFSHSASSSQGVISFILQDDSASSPGRPSRRERKPTPKGYEYEAAGRATARIARKPAVHATPDPSDRSSSSPASVTGEQ